MPHNWTNAELIALIRDMFVTDDGGTLHLGRGIPAAWEKAGATIRVTDMTTRSGRISFTLTCDGAKWEIAACTGSGGCVLDA